MFLYKMESVQWNSNQENQKTWQYILNLYYEVESNITKMLHI